jgi:hypothetical protein
MSEIYTRKWLDWNVGKGKRFESLTDLLNALEEIRKIFGKNCGFAGGPIDMEIEIVKEMILRDDGSRPECRHFAPRGCMLSGLNCTPECDDYELPDPG